MQTDRWTRMFLGVIAASLAVIAVRPYVQPVPVMAQANADPIYVEPGVTLLRIPNGGQVLGKVMTNLRTGEVWGYPTNGELYPVAPLDGKPMVSRPMPLGRFAVGEARQ